MAGEFNQRSDEENIQVLKIAKVRPSPVQLAWEAQPRGWGQEQEGQDPQAAGDTGAQGGWGWPLNSRTGLLWVRFLHGGC